MLYDKGMKISTTAACPICGERFGFHGNACYSYAVIPEVLRRPVGKEAFEEWLKEAREIRALNEGN